LGLLLVSSAVFLPLSNRLEVQDPHPVRHSFRPLDQDIASDRHLLVRNCARLE